MDFILPPMDLVNPRTNEKIKNIVLTGRVETLSAGDYMKCFRKTITKLLMEMEKSECNIFGFLLSEMNGRNQTEISVRRLSQISGYSEITVQKVIDSFRVKNVLKKHKSVIMLNPCVVFKTTNSRFDELLKEYKEFVDTTAERLKQKKLS